MNIYVIVEMFGGCYSGIRLVTSSYEKATEEFKKLVSSIVSLPSDDPNLMEKYEDYLSNDGMNEEYHLSEVPLEITGDRSFTIP